MKQTWTKSPGPRRPPVYRNFVWWCHRCTIRQTCRRADSHWTRWLPFDSGIPCTVAVSRCPNGR